MCDWLTSEATVVSKMRMDGHEVSVVQFDGDSLFYGVLELPEGVLSLYGRDEKELRRAFESAMGAKGARVQFDVTPATYCLVYALAASVLVAQKFSPDKAPVILTTSAMALLLALIMRLSVGKRPAVTSTDGALVQIPVRK